jgi:Mitochondrial ribosomal death-associated protein 3
MLRFSLQLVRRGAARPTSALFRCFGARILEDESPNEDGVNSVQQSHEIFYYSPTPYTDLILTKEKIEAKQKKKEKILESLQARTGLGFTDPWHVSEEEWATELSIDDLPDWTPANTSKISLETVKTFEGGIPTISEMAQISLPPSAPPHPTENHPQHALRRKETHYRHIRAQVEPLAQSKLDHIKTLATWEEKQDEIDDLFESVEFALKEKETVLGRHPNFGNWVETALHDYLESVQNRDIEGSKKGKQDTEKERTGKDNEMNNTELKTLTSQDKATEMGAVQSIADTNSEEIPIFIDLFEGQETGDVVPTILHPLKPHPKHGPGRMVEEWELAAHQQTKRIMLRQATTEIAQIMNSEPSYRVYINGDAGVGKTSVLLSLVASARKSGQIVLFIPDGNRLRAHGFYVDPNPVQAGLFDLPVLSQELCVAFLASHERDLDGFVAPPEIIEKYFRKDLEQRIPQSFKDDFSLIGLLRLAKQEVVFAPMCYSIVVETLMNQDVKPFSIMLDDFNCYYDHGQYFHMDYDPEVEEAIPLNRITLFKPFLDAMGFSTTSTKVEQNPPFIKRGGVIAAISESKAVARRFTDGLNRFASLAAASGDKLQPRFHHVIVPSYSNVEFRHMLFNYDIIGIGQLRFNRGSYLINEQESNFLRMLSGSNGQLLLNACVNVLSY